MSPPSFERYSSADAIALAKWLAADSWPFHGKSRQSPEAYRQKIVDGAIAGDDEQVFWIHVASDQRAGLLRLLDLSDPTPMFDLRLRTDLRRRGIGRAAVQWLTRYIFETMPDKMRVEGHTREDNLGMRRVFRACGYVKEAHHRDAWPADDGTLHASIGNGITRSDWVSNTVTPVQWEDE